MRRGDGGSEGREGTKVNLLFSFRVLLESKEQLQISMETSMIWQKEYKEREEIVNGTLLKQNEHIK